LRSVEANVLFETNDKQGNDTLQSKSVTKILGDTGCGKTKRLIELAVQFADPQIRLPQSVSLIGFSQAHRQSLKNQLARAFSDRNQKAVQASPKNRLPLVQSMDSWLFQILKTIQPEYACKQLPHQAEVVMIHQLLHGQVLPVDHLLYYAKNQSAFLDMVSRSFTGLNQLGLSSTQRSAFQNQVPNNNPDSGKALFNWLGSTYTQYLALLDAWGYCSKSQICDLLLSALDTLPSTSATSLPTTLQALTGHVVLIDEAQELSAQHHQILAKLPIQVILAGNATLSIRQLRGAYPQGFETLSAYSDNTPKIVAELSSPEPCVSSRLNPFLRVLLTHPVHPENTVSENGTPQQTASAARNTQPESSGLESNNNKKNMTPIQFGWFENPAQEAESLANCLLNWKQQPADPLETPEWHNCAILLRRADHRDILAQALQRYNIPFTGIPEVADIQTGKTFLRHLFQLFASWQQLGVTVASPASEAVDVITCHHWMLARDDIHHMPNCYSALENSNEQLLALFQYLGCEQPESLETLSQNNTDSPLEQRSLFMLCRNSGHINTVTLCCLDMLTRWYAVCFPGRLSSGSSSFDASTPPEVGALLNQLLTNWSANRAMHQDDRSLFLRLKTDFKIALEQFLAGFTTVSASYQMAAKHPMSFSTVLSCFEMFWQKPDETALSHGQDGTMPDAVKILSIHQAQGLHFSWVALPFLQSSTLPGLSPDMSQCLTEEFLRYYGLFNGLSDSGGETQPLPITLASSTQLFAEEARLMATAITRSTETLLISCHQDPATENQTTNQGNSPSPFFLRLLYQAQQNSLPQTNIHRSPATGTLALTCCDATCCSHQPVPLNALPSANHPSASLPDNLTSLMPGQMNWADLPASAERPVFEANEYLSLSASSVKTYMVCPRQFFYQHLLVLPQPKTIDYGQLGKLLHRLMEVFNQQANRGEVAYTGENLLTYCKYLFSEPENPQAFYHAGFTDTDREQLAIIPVLARYWMQEHLEASIQDLIQKGYFDRYGSMQQIHAEYALRQAEIPELPGCQWKGSVDACIQLQNNQWELIDYKTALSAYTTGLDTCDKQFAKLLDPLAEDPLECDHTTLFFSRLQRNYPRDYQLLLYYWILSNQTEFSGALAGISLQMVRPAFSDNPTQGSIRLSISAAHIEANQATLLNDLNHAIITPIREALTFPVNPEGMGISHCDPCPYQAICDGKAGLQPDVLALETKQDFVAIEKGVKPA
jgi:hypothetical protein